VAGKRQDLAKRIQIFTNGEVVVPAGAVVPSKTYDPFRG